MPHTIALLRGVNIGKRQLSMAALRGALHGAGCGDVVTYVQSGNVVLTPPAGVATDLGPWLATIIGQVAGFAVDVVVRTPAQIARVVEGNPYPTSGGTQLHVLFYADEPSADLFGGIDIGAYSPEHCTLAGREIYLHLPNGMGRAELPSAIERAARRLPPTISTARNWNTVLKLLELTGG